MKREVGFIKKAVAGHRGSLDYAEFVLDPKNKGSTYDQMEDAVRDYLQILGILTAEDLREWILEKLKEERAKYE